MTSTRQPTDQEILAVLGMAHLNERDLCESLRVQFPRTLEEYQAEIREINEANGWFDSERSFGDDIALLHSEVSEMYEAYRDHGFDDVTRRQCRVFDHSHPVPEGSDHVCKPEGVGSEAADVLVRLLDTCERHGIDLRAELERKIVYNRTRGYRHGGKRV